MRYRIFQILLIFMFSTMILSVVSFGADDMGMGTDMPAEDAGMDMSMSSSMIPYHILEIILAIVVSILVFNVIRATGQMNVFIYIPLGMLVFVAGSIIGYLPHITSVDHNFTMTLVLVLNSIMLALMGLSFYKWKRMLG